MYATFYTNINACLKRFFWISLPISAIALVIGFIFYEPLSLWGSCLLLMTVAQRYTWNNIVTYFLGKMCIGIYLFLHFSTLTLEPYITNEVLWLVLNASFILFLAILLYGLELLIAKAIGLLRIAMVKKKEKRLHYDA